MKKIYILFLLLFIGCKSPHSVIIYKTIPLPQSIQYTKQQPFVLDAKTVITYPQGNALQEKNASFLASYIKEFTGMPLKIQAGVTNGKRIVLKTDLQNANQEAYQLTVTSDQITIDGASPAGVFYGIQTLRKSIDVTHPKALDFPSVVINDAPRFA